MAFSSLVLAGCPAGDDNGDNGDSEVANSTGEDTGEDGDSESEVTSSSSPSSVSQSSSFGSSEEGGSSGDPMTSTSDPATSANSGSSGDPNACDPVIPGEWNACHDDMGEVDNTQCNWMGIPDANGFIGCLVSSRMPEYNTCFISECEDACDCFAPPPTGTATVQCGEILADGGTGCYLDCSNGETCPDGMECVGTTCFHPPAE